MIDVVRGDLVEVDGVWMVETPDGLAEPNPMELMLKGRKSVDPSLMSRSEFEEFRMKCLEKLRRTSRVSDEEYAERMRRERIRREGLKP